MVNMIAYINRIKNKEPRSVDSEPRSNYADGLKVDPVADSAKKISQVLGAYKRYRRGEKNPVINFSKFFEMWARENFADGQLVRNTVDGSRPGYAGKEDPYIFTLKGRHAKKKYYHLLITDRTGGETKIIAKKMLEATPTNLKKLQKLRDQKVKEQWPNRISDEKFRELRTSDKYKNLNNEDFAEVLKGKKYKSKFGSDWSVDRVQNKQQHLNLLGEVGYKPQKLTPEKEILDVMKTIRGGPKLVKEYIKTGRPEKRLENFRSRVVQKVHYEKYGNTPEKVARGLEWRLRNPEKVKARNMKRFAGTGLFPNGTNYKEHLWRDLWRSSQTKAGERFKFVSELPPLKKTKSGTQVRDWLKDDFYKKIKFKDTETGKIINFNNLQKYLDQTMGEGTYAKSISGYELKDTLKNQKITYKGKTGTIGGLLKQNLYSPEQLAKQKLLSPLHMQHPGGVGKNWWVNEVAFSDANMGLRDLDATLTGKLKRAKGFTKKKALLQKYAKDVEKLPGGITSVLRSKTYGETPTPTSVMKAAGKEAGIKGKNWNQYLDVIKDAGIPCIKGVGGNCTTPEDFRKGFNQLVKEGAGGDKLAVSKMAKFTKGMRGLKGAATWTGYGLLAEAGFMVPFAVGDYASGESWKRILGNATDYGFGPILGQSEQEEFEAALPEGSKAVEGEKAIELSEQLQKLDEQKFRPQGRIGMDQARKEKSRENVITGITDEFKLNLDPFLSDTPFAKDQWHQGMWNQAHQDAADARAQIAKENLERLQKRRDTGTIAQEDWMVGGDTRGYATGGLAGLMKKYYD